MPLALLFIACSPKDLIDGFNNDDDDGQGQDVDVTLSNVYFHINVALPSDITGSQNSHSALRDYRGNLVDDGIIQTITLFVVDYDSATGEDNWSNCKYSTIAVDKYEPSCDSDTDTYYVSIRFALTVTRGPKHVYTAANLSADLISQCASTGKYVSPAALGDDDYYDVISHFIDSDTGAVAMFSAERSQIFVDDDSTSSLGSQDNPYDYSFTLQSLLSKILLTCDMDEDGEHVTIKANIDSLYCDDYKGWIKLSSVLFKLGTTNRTTYFAKHTDEATNAVVDPNYHVADQIQIDRHTGEWSYVTDYLNDFTYSSTISTDFAPDRYVQALAYDSDRMPNGFNDDIRYTEGMYCLENTTDNNWSALDDYDALLSTRANWYVGPRLISTTVDIRARYIPAAIIGKDCMNAINTSPSTATTIAERLAEIAQLTPRCFNDEDEAERYIIAESSRPAAGQATYYSLLVGDSYYFFTYQGALQYIQLVQDAGITDYFRTDTSSGASSRGLYPFTIYDDGAIYYYTYLNRIADGNPDQTISGIERNNYYILRSTYLAVPSPINAASQPITTYTRAM